MPKAVKKLKSRKRFEVIHGGKLPRPKEKVTLLYWLGGKSVVKDIAVNTEFDIVEIGEKGISRTAVETLAEYIGVSRKSMAEDILDVSVKTIERKDPQELLDKKISAHAVEIARVMQHAYEVFEDVELARQWLGRENAALNGKKPLELFETLTGINLVNDILSRIEEGVYS